MSELPSPKAQVQATTLEELSVKAVVEPKQISAEEKSTVGKLFTVMVLEMS